MNDPEIIKRVMKAFVMASKNVFTQMTHCEIEIGKAYEKKHSYPSYDYSFYIGVTGGFEGAITMSLKEETAFFIASTLLGDKPVEKFDELAESALREISNMTVASAFNTLEENGDRAVTISPPTFVRGKNVSFAVSNIDRTFITSLNTPKGVVEFVIALS